jgi:cytochrome P450
MVAYDLCLGGHVTTREFIVMAAWHLLEKNNLRARFLAGDEMEE